MTPFNPDELRCVALAIRQAWEECGEVPFPLYESEAEELAKAAITAICRPAADEIERLRADNDKLRQEADWLLKVKDEYRADCERLRTENIELQAELDRFKKPIKGMDELRREINARRAATTGAESK